MPRSAAVADADRLLAEGRKDEAILRIDGAVRAGDADATLHAAIWRLVGAPLPRDLLKARALLERAAEAGNVDAGAMLTALIANGSGAEPDWPRALTLLRKLASRDTRAAAQLQLIEAMAVDDHGSPIAAPDARQLHETPRIVVLPGFATSAECRHLIETVYDIIAPALVVDPKTGRQARHPVRTSDGAVIGPTREDMVVRAINQRIALASGTSVFQGEALAILRYQNGQEYRPHLDSIAGAKNQRIRTVLLYLNDDFSGGETLFTNLGLKITPRTGDALMFDNTGPDNLALAQSEHAGLPVTRGTKWLATRWIRAHPVDPWQPLT